MPCEFLQILRQSSENSAEKFTHLQKLWCFHFSLALLMQAVNRNPAKAGHCFADIDSKAVYFLTKLWFGFLLSPSFSGMLYRISLLCSPGWSTGAFVSSEMPDLFIPTESKITGVHLSSTDNLRS